MVIDQEHRIHHNEMDEISSNEHIPNHNTSLELRLQNIGNNGPLNSINNISNNNNNVNLHNANNNTNNNIGTNNISNNNLQTNDLRAPHYLRGDENDFD